MRIENATWCRTGLAVARQRAHAVDRSCLRVAVPLRGGVAHAARERPGLPGDRRATRRRRLFSESSLRMWVKQRCHVLRRGGVRPRESGAVHEVHAAPSLPSRTLSVLLAPRAVVPCLLGPAADPLQEHLGIEVVGRGVRLLGERLARTASRRCRVGRFRRGDPERRRPSRLPLTRTPRSLSSAMSSSPAFRAGLGA